MTSSIRHTISAATALGLVSFIFTSALVSGLFATPTLVAFAVLAAYGVVEIAILSYAMPRPYTPSAARRPVVIRRAARATARVPALVEYPSMTRACAA